MAKSPNWTAAELAVLRDGYGRRMSKDIAASLPGRSANAIMLKARDLGLPSNRSVTRKRYEVNRAYFDVPNVENSYWAGFIAADGNIERGKSRVRIKLHAADTEHLEAFRLACGAEVEVKDEKNGQRRYRLLDINGVPEWVSALRMMFNITPAKTLTLVPPAGLDRHEALAFITGYIDGDGCISVDRLPSGANGLRIQVSGTAAVLTWIKEWFDRLALSERTPAQVRQMASICSYRIAGAKAEAVAVALMALPTPRLNRKWNRALACLAQRAA